MSNTFEQAASSKQAATGGRKFLAMALCLQNGIQVAQNNQGANLHHKKRFSCRFEPSSRSMPDLVPKTGNFGAAFRAIIQKTQDDGWFVQ